MQGIGRGIRTAIALLGLAVLLAGCTGTASGPGGVDALSVTQLRGDAGKPVPLYDVKARGDGAPTEKLVVIAMRRAAELTLEKNEKAFALVDQRGFAAKLNQGGKTTVLSRHVLLRVAIGTPAIAAVAIKKGKDIKIYEAKSVIATSRRRIRELDNGAPERILPTVEPEEKGQDI